MNGELRRRKLRWFQIGLRDILALTLISAILLAWWNDRRATAERLVAAEDAIAKQANQHRAEIDRLHDEHLEKLVAIDDEFAAYQLEETSRHFRSSPLQRTLAHLCLLPRTVSGLVVQVSQQKLVEIDLGSDDGLKQGQVLDVFRLGETVDSARYLGKIQLTSVNKATALGKILPGAQGKIHEADHVATRIEEQ
jgi:hypothetical protein